GRGGVAGGALSTILQWSWPGEDPAIHRAVARGWDAEAWIAGTSPAMTSERGLLQQLPPKRLATLQIPRGHPTQDLRQVLGRESEARTDGADVALGQGFALADVGHDIQRAAMVAAGLLGLDLLVVDRAQGLPGVAAVAHQPRQLVRLQGEGGIHSAVGAGQGEMLLDDAGAQ